MGAGDDTFVWNPGDGSDNRRRPGRLRHDAVQRLQPPPSRSTSPPTARASGSPATWATSPWTSTASRGSTSNALGGADTITVNDLSGTDVTGINLDLSGTPGSGTGDGQADTVIVNGTNNADAIQISGSGTKVAVAGLPAVVAVEGSEGANDRLVVNALGGDDTVSACRTARHRDRADHRWRRGQ